MASFNNHLTVYPGSVKPKNRLKSTLLSWVFVWVFVYLSHMLGFADPKKVNHCVNQYGDHTHSLV